MATISQVISAAAARIKSDSARLDAELLLSRVLGVERSYFFTWPDRALSQSQWQDFEQLLARRIDGEPVAHILGQRGFWTLQLAVDASTLIPRPDTEVLVETALNLLPDEPLDVVDVGTGSGAIALALKSERPSWRMLAGDASLAACRLAKRNAASNALDVPLFCGDWLHALADASMDVVLSNPPYIEATDPHLNEGDVRFEPRSALVAGARGLADLVNIAEQSIRVLRSGGWLMMEHGFDQRQAVTSQLRRLGYHRVESFKDFGGHWRITVGVKN